MRAALIPLLLALASCGRGDEPANEAGSVAEPAVASDSNWGAGRDRMCLKDERAGLIVYAAEGDSNCMVQGAAVRAEGGYRIKPDGDESCAIDVRIDQGAAILGDVSPACAYYCGPKSSFAGKRLEPTNVSEPALDLAGDPLC